MKILAIETSCDETAIAIVKFEIRNSKFEILSNIVSSQVKLHAKYGGVYPSLAKREHQKNLPVVFKKALKEAKSASRRTAIDLLAVTTGPGLEPCLWVGINFAKDLAEKLNVPIVSVNHIEAHMLANFVHSNFQFPISNFQKTFPAICLVVSGGHTGLFLMKGIGKYKLIGETRDDAAGECFDKAARVLGLGYPGGPLIDRWADQRTGSKFRVELPRPMINQKNYDFSFSGLKTAVLYDFKNRSAKTKKDKKYIQEMCSEIQRAIIDVLIKKTIRAAKNFKAKSIILGGGVVASKELRRQFEAAVKKETPAVKCYMPDAGLHTDNALMVAVTAFFRKNKARKNWKTIKADANLRIG